MLLNQIHVGNCSGLSCRCLRCYGGCCCCFRGSSPLAYIRGLIRRTDRGVPNAVGRMVDAPKKAVIFVTGDRARYWTNPA